MNLTQTLYFLTVKLLRNKNFNIIFDNKQRRIFKKDRFQKSTVSEIRFKSLKS